MNDLPELPRPDIEAYTKTGCCGGHSDEAMLSFAREAMEIGRRAGLEEAARIAEKGVSVPYDSPPAPHMHIAVPELAAAIRQAAVSNEADSGKSN